MKNLLTIDELYEKTVTAGTTAGYQMSPTNDRDKSLDIPRLTKESKWPEVKKYLEWLWNSPFRYHIDDDPKDIDSFTEKEQEVLAANSDIMWSFSTDGGKGSKLWDVYYKDEDLDPQHHK